MKRLSYWIVLLVLYPISFLPFPVIYWLSDVSFYILFYLVGYRKKVVFENLERSFPEKAGKEIKNISRQFYRSFCDIIFEGIKFLTLSETEIAKRFIFENAETINKLHDEGKSAIMTLGHCGNWEMAGLAASILLKHNTIVFYRPLRNEYFDRLIKKTRGRFGMDLLPDNQVRQMLRQQGQQPNLYIFITDQTPHNVKTSYWTTFLNQETPVFRGTEKIAKMTNLPVFFARIKRIKRGFYTAKFLNVSESPSGTGPDEITEIHTRLLETAIKENPYNWLWSHRRWKRKKPANVSIANRNVSV